MKINDNFFQHTNTQDTLNFFFFLLPLSRFCVIKKELTIDHDCMFFNRNVYP